MSLRLQFPNASVYDSSVFREGFSNQICHKIGHIIVFSSKKMIFPFLYASFPSSVVLNSPKPENHSPTFISLSEQLNKRSRALTKLSQQINTEALFAPTTGEIMTLYGLYIYRSDRVLIHHCPKGDLGPGLNWPSRKAGKLKSWGDYIERILRHAFTQGMVQKELYSDHSHSVEIK